MVLAVIFSAAAVLFTICPLFYRIAPTIEDLFTMLYIN